MQTIKFNAGDTILSEGEDGNTAFLIVAGSVEVTVGKGAKAKSVGTLETGDVFGEMCLLDPGHRSATIKALTDTECVVTSYDEFMGSIQESPEQAIEFMKTLVRRLRHMNDLMSSMDPRKRSLSDVLRDWVKSVESREAYWSEEDKIHFRKYYDMTYPGMW